jgi:hypothetical protein
MSNLVSTTALLIEAKTGATRRQLIGTHCSGPFRLN